MQKRRNLTTPQPAIARMLAQHPCSAVLLSTLAGMGLALFAADRPAWFPFASRVSRRRP